MASKTKTTKTNTRRTGPARALVKATSTGKPAELNSKLGSPAAKLTKRNQLAALLIRDEGATIDQMIAATGWLPHTVRAALTGLKKTGYAIDSDKIDGLRTYRAVAPQ